MTRVLVCGGRDFPSAKVRNWLTANLRSVVSNVVGHDSWTLEAIIEGGAKGADEGAAQWADHEGVTLLEFAADWATFGRSAGPRRNALMLSEGRPDIVIAFPGGRGTANMVSQAKEAGVIVILVADDHER